MKYCRCVISVELVHIPAVRTLSFPKYYGWSNSLSVILIAVANDNTYKHGAGQCGMQRVLSLYLFHCDEASIDVLSRPFGVHEAQQPLCIVGILCCSGQILVHGAPDNGLHSICTHENIASRRCTVLEAQNDSIRRLLVGK